MTLDEMSQNMSEDQKREILGKKTYKALHSMKLQDLAKCTDTVVRMTLLSMVRNK